MNIAVSACLLGTPCRYDGESRPCASAIALRDGHRVVSVCPEALGGLQAPRLPSEIATAERAVRVTDAGGVDTTDAFLIGAQRTLERVQEAGCALAVLKSKSPSCGSGLVHDGTFSSALVPGYGVAARALREAGVRVVDEAQLQACLEASCARHPGQPPALLASSSSECPVLETERLVLRALASDDVEDVFAYCSDPDVGPDAGWPVHRTIDDSRLFVEVIASAPHVFGVFERATEGACVEESAASRAFRTRVSASVSATGPCIGSIGLIADPQRRNVDCLMLGYALAKRSWGRGYMTEASREVLRYGFEELGLSLITCTHYTFNGRSRRVIEKSGFLHEGAIHGAEATPDGLMRDFESYYLPRERWEEFADAPADAGL